MPGLADHILVFILAIALPVYAIISWKSFQRKLGAGKPRVRLNGYMETLLVQWSFTLALLLLWWLREREYSGLGLSISWNFRFYVGTAAALAGCIFLIRQWIRVLRLSGQIPDSLRNQIKPVADMMPRTWLERKFFITVSLTAGICEEILYRGFLVWYVDQYATWLVACAVSALFFGFGHLYQGRAGILKTTAVGLFLVLLYLWSGSLIGPMILHAVTDITGGLIGSEVVSAVSRSKQSYANTPAV